MPTLNDITTLNIDEVSYDVADLSTEAQELVEVYNRWNQKESDARGELAILQAAKQTLSAQIVATVRAEMEAKAAEEAAAEVEAEAANDTVADVVATTEANVTTDETMAANTEEAAADAVVAAK